MMRKIPSVLQSERIRKYTEATGIYEGSAKCLRLSTITLQTLCRGGRPGETEIS